MKISKPASRIFALLLAVFMVFGMLPVSAFAAGETVTYKQVTTIEAGKQYILAVKSSDSGADSTSSYAVTASTDSDNQKLKTKVNFTGDINQNNATVALADGNDYSKVLWTATAVEGGIKLTNGSLAIGRNASGKGLVVSSNNTDSALFVHTVENGKIYNADGNTKYYLGYGDVGSSKYSFGFAQSNASMYTSNIRIFTAEDTSDGEGGSTNPPAQPENLTKVDTLTDGKYIIVSTDRALDLDVADTYNRSSYGSSYKYDGFNGKAVTISDNKITGDVYKDMVWEVKAVSGGYSIKSTYASGSDVYLSGSYVNNYGLLELNSDAAVWTYSDSKLTTGGKSIANSDTDFNFFTMRSTGSDVAFYAVTDESGFLAPTYGGNEGGDSTATKTVEITTNKTASSATENVSIEVGESFTLKLTNGSSADKTHAISNTNSSVASVDASNNFNIVGSGTKEITITGLKNGETTITFTGTNNGGSTYYAVVNVTVGTGVSDGGNEGGDSSESETVEITATSSGATANATIAVGETLIVELTNSSSYNAKTFSGESANPAIATVESGSKSIAGGATSDFEVQGVAAGNTTITFTGTGSGSAYTATINLTVTGEGGAVTPPEDETVEPTDEIHLAFTSDIHNNGDVTTNGTGANNLSKWLKAVANTNNDTFDTMGFCGDNGDRNSYGDAYWSKVQIVMDVVSGSDYVDAEEGFFVDGNHEYINGYQTKDHTNSNATSKKIKLIGEKLTDEDYVLYSFGATGSSESSGFDSADITALDNYLKTVDSKKPVFVLSHFPIHYYSNRTTANAQALVTVLNKYPNVIFLWGHNHTLSDSYYDEVYEAGSELPLTSSSNSKVKINFTYAAAGCMADTSTAAGVQADGLVAKVVDNKVVLTYYSLSGNVVGQPTTITIEEREPEHQHVYGAPTYTGDGKTSYVATRKCSCDDTQTATATITSEVTTPATCTAAGTRTYTANFTEDWATDKTTTEAIAKLDHDFEQGECTVCGAEDPDYVPESPATKKYLIVSNGYAMTSREGEGYQNTGSTSSQKYNYTGLAGVEYNPNSRAAVTEDMLWTIEEVSGGYRIKQGDKILNASYGSNSTGGNDGKLMLNNTDDTWSRSGNLLKSKNADKFLTVGNPTSSDTSQTLFTVRSESNAKDVQFIEYSGSTPEPQPKTLESIAVTTQPTKKAYTAGEDFAAAGMVVTATYSDESTAPVTGYTVTDGEDLTVGKTSVTVSYTEDGVTKTTTVAITVTAASTPDDDEPSYTKVNASDIKVDDKIIIVGKNGNNYYALTNGSNQKTAVTVTNNELTISGSASALVWTVGEATGNQVDTANGNDLDFVFSNGSTYFGRVTDTNVVEFATGSAANTKYFGHDIVNSTIGNYSRGGAYYGLLYQNNQFIYVENANNSNASVLFFKAYNVADDNDEPATKTLESIAVTTNPTKMTYTAGEDFASAGMVVTATYSDNSKAAVTGYTISGGDDMTAGTKTITISYTEGGVTKSTTLNVTVNAATTPDDDEPSYTKINASDIKVNDKIIIVGKDGNNYYALTNGSNQKTAVTVTNNELTISGSASALVWTVGEATGNQVDTANGNDLDFVFSNGSTYFGRVTDTNVVEFATGSAANTKYFGHDIASSTIGNYSRGGAYYGLLYQNNQFIYVENANNSNASVLFFKAYNVADDDDNQGGGNQGGTVTPNPEGTTFVAFSSDVHSQTTSTTSGSPARLNSWINTVSGVVGGTFDTMAFCGDNADGTGNANGNAYWDRVEAVMSVVSSNNKVNGDGIFINGNHEHSNGQVTSSNHATAKKIKNIGYTVNEEDYAIYVFGAASSNQSYNTSDITALGNWLKTAPTNKPIFIISHFPIHSAAGRTTGNADTLRTTLNEYADDHDIYFLWGHNHTNANNGENHYDKVYTGTLDNQTIKFTYLAAGCMSDNEYSGGSQAVKGKGLVAKIVDGKVETLTYYGESGNVVLSYKVDNTPVDPDQPGTEDPIVPDEPGKVTTLEDGYYILVSNNNTKALTNSANSGYSNSNGYSYSGFDGADVTISGDKITKGATESMVFEIKAVTGGYTIRNVEKNQYLTATYTQSSSGSGYDGKLFLSDTAETWELDSNFRLKSTNASQNGRNLGLYLTYDDKADSLSTGAANFFGIRSEGENHDFANVDKIDFYKVEVKDEPEQPDQPGQPDEPEQPEEPEVKTLIGIEVTTQPTKTTYTAGDDFEPAGMVVTATYDDNSKAEVTGWTVANSTGLVEGVTRLTVSYTEGEVTKTTTVAITVTALELFEIDSANMTLGNNLSMNFYVNPEYLEGNEEYYAEITKTYADGRDDVVVLVDDDNWGVDSRDGFYYFTLDKVAAKEMADAIYVVIYRDETEDVAVSEVWEDSVRAYAERALKKEEDKTASDADKLALYVDLLNYGAEAQNYFKYNVSDLANKNLTAEQKAYGQDEVTMTDESVRGTGYAGMDLVLESSIIVDFYFTSIPDNHDDMYAIATYTNHYGEAQEIRVEGEAFLQDPADGCWYAPVKGLVVADCMQMVTIQVYDANGSVVGNAKDSVASYTARLANASPLYVAIMKFAVSAYNSFH